MDRMPELTTADNPVITPSPPGSWDGGQISEAAVIFYDGMFHTWYAGYTEKNILRADIGYAYSEDGKHWVKYPDNPVASASCVPRAWIQHRISEPHVLIEGDKIYLYHTGARYKGTTMHDSLGLSIGSTGQLVRRESYLPCLRHVRLHEYLNIRRMKSWIRLFKRSFRHNFCFPLQTSSVIVKI